MGRGLSELQRWILRRAGETQGIVYYADILEGFFGWVPKHPLIRYGTHHSYPADEAKGNYLGTLVRPGSKHFSPEAIGERRYRSTMVTLSRTCIRLRQRGLVDLFEALIPGGQD